jgi:hypothetical protein
MGCGTVLCACASSYCAGVTVDALRGGVYIRKMLAFTAMCGLRSLLLCRFILIPCSPAEPMSDHVFNLMLLTSLSAGFLRRADDRFGPVTCPHACRQPVVGVGVR